MMTAGYDLETRSNAAETDADRCGPAKRQSIQPLTRNERAMARKLAAERPWIPVRATRAKFAERVISATIPVAFKKLSSKLPMLGRRLNGGTARP
jgi:hypothetical protein